MAIELKLAKPHSAKVTMATVRARRSVALPRSMKATNSLSTSLVPNSPPARIASAQSHRAEQPEHRRENITQQIIGRTGRAGRTANWPIPPSSAVGQRHQRHEGQHHRADRDRQLHAGLRALAGGHDDVGGRFLVTNAG
jgi:hypothetical protein